MAKRHSILVVIDPASGDQPALAKAARFAEHIDADLALLACIYDIDLAHVQWVTGQGLEHLRDAAIDAQFEVLADLAKPLRSAGRSVSIKVVWDNPLHEAIVREVLESSPDFVVKDTHHHSALSRALFTNTDWHLIRECPAPLWLVKPQPLPEHATIMAAIDPTHEHDQTAALDHRIIETAQLFSVMLMALAIVDSDSHHLDFKKMRIVRGVREAAEIISLIASGEFHQGYDGEVFKLKQTFKTSFTTAPRPQVFTCSMGPQMLRMGARIADGLQVGDVTPGRMAEVMTDVHAGLAKRTAPADDFRVGNFWAWHIKKDREQSMYEARCGLFARAEVIPPNIGLDHLLDAEEAQLVRDNFRNFLIAGVTGSGEIKDVPPELVQRLIDAVSSSGDYDDIDREIERYREFERAGLTDLVLRVSQDTRRRCH